jgi:putative proteasome-type protease
MDLVVYEANAFQTDKIVCIDENNPYFRMLHSSWGQKLREVFDSIEDPMWRGESTDIPLMLQSTRSLPMKKITTPEEKLI